MRGRQEERGHGTGEDPLRAAHVDGLAEGCSLSPFTLFVYGSLRRGQRHHAQLGAARFVRAARSLAGHQLVRVGNYPGLAAGQTHQSVVGELFVLPSEAVAKLDAFEGEAYERRRILLDDGTSAEAYWVREPELCEPLGVDDFALLAAAER